jgi:hypothetical protein
MYILRNRVQKVYPNLKDNTFQWFRYALLVPTVARVHFLNLKPLVCILFLQGLPGILVQNIGVSYLRVLVSNVYSNNSYNMYNQHHDESGRINQVDNGMTSPPTIPVEDIPQDHTKQHHQRPLLHHPPSTPPMSAINPAIVVAHIITHVITHLVARGCPPSTPTVVGQVIAHHHCRGSPPSPFSMSRR